MGDNTFQENYHYNFDAPMDGNFEDIPVDDIEWFKKLNEKNEENDKENTQIVEKLKGIQRASWCYKTNSENTTNALNEVNTSAEIAHEDPRNFMENKKLEKLKQNYGKDESVVNPNDIALLSLNNQQERSGLFNKAENAIKTVSNAKQITKMTACKPKLPQQTINKFNKTAVKSGNILQLAQTGVQREQNVKCLGRVIGNVNLGGTTTKKQPITSTPSTRPLQMPPQPPPPTKPTKEERVKKVFDNPANVPVSLKKPKQPTTVPIAPLLATSQRANLKKEKLQSDQLTTAAKTMTIGRQFGGSGKPPQAPPFMSAARTPFPKSATISRIGGTTERKHGNLCNPTGKSDQPKEKVLQSKPPSQKQQVNNNSNTAVVMVKSSSSNFTSKKTVRNPAIPAAWNY